LRFENAPWVPGERQGQLRFRGLTRILADILFSYPYFFSFLFPSFLSVTYYLSANIYLRKSVPSAER